RAYVDPRHLHSFPTRRSSDLDSLDAIAAQTLPAGSSQALAGESRELRESGTALYFAFGLALLVVYMVLASQFGSLVHPFTVLLRSEEHTSELQSRENLVCRLL